MSQFLDSIPQVVLFALVLVAMLVAYEAGFRTGAWRVRRNPDEKEGPTSTLVGALLAFMAFLIAITMGMAADRFEARRGLVQEEANAIHIAYLNAGYLPQAQTDQIREILREYVPLRIGTSGITPEEIQARVAASNDLMTQAWTVTQNLILINPAIDTYGVFVDSMNDVISTGASRATAVTNRVPEAIMLFLILGSVFAVGLVGYDAGLTLRRSLIAAVLLIVLFSAVLYLVLDINQPASGIFQISQQPLISVKQQIEAPPTP